MTELSNVSENADLMLTIWNDVKDFGPSFWAFIILFIIVSYKEHLINWCSTLLGLFVRNKKELKFTTKQLAKHQIFKDIEYWLNIGIKAIQLKSSLHQNDDEEDYVKNKEKMAKEVLRINFEVTLDTLTKFVAENDLDNMDEDVACAYLMDALTKNDITILQKYIERGISKRFIHKFSVINNMGKQLIFSSIKNIFQKGCTLDTPTKVYLAFNSLDGYLNVIFNNMAETIDTINGDLKGETFDGEPMCRSFKTRKKPPHPTYSVIVEEKLEELLLLLYASRISVIKYFKEGEDRFHSSIYEVVRNGVTSEIENMQYIDENAEKNILHVMEKNGIIAAKINKFDGTTLERFVARGLKGIIIAPIYNDNIIDGALVIDYISEQSFEKACSFDDLDDIIKSYTEFLAPYIVYHNEEQK